MIFKTMNPEELKNYLPVELQKRIDTLEKKIAIRNKITPVEKIVAFDLDNTLLVGDIGDAVFALLKIIEKETGKPLSISNKAITLTYREYNEVLENKGKKVAYPLMTTSMVGIPREKLIEITKEAANWKSTSLEIEGLRIPVPYPNPVMQALTFYLKFLGYKIYIISATNQFSVEWAAKEFFDISPEYVFAMKPAVSLDIMHGHILGDFIEGPITVETGKVDAYKLLVGKIPPLITAGDSTTDLEILDLTDPDGLIIWVHEKNEMEESLSFLSDRLSRHSNIYTLDRGLGIL